LEDHANTNLLYTLHGHETEVRGLFVVGTTIFTAGTLMCKWSNFEYKEALEDRDWSCPTMTYGSASLADVVKFPLVFVVCIVQLSMIALTNLFTWDGRDRFALAIVRNAKDTVLFDVSYSLEGELLIIFWWMFYTAFLVLLLYVMAIKSQHQKISKSIACLSQELARHPAAQLKLELEKQISKQKHLKHLFFLGATVFPVPIVRCLASPFRCLRADAATQKALGVTEDTYVMRANPSIVCNWALDYGWFADSGSYTHLMLLTVAAIFIPIFTLFVVPAAVLRADVRLLPNHLGERFSYTSWRRSLERVQLVPTGALSLLAATSIPLDASMVISKLFFPILQDVLRPEQITFAFICVLFSSWVFFAVVAFPMAQFQHFSRCMKAVGACFWWINMTAFFFAIVSASKGADVGGGGISKFVYRHHFKAVRPWMILCPGFALVAIWLAISLLRIEWCKRMSGRRAASVHNNLPSKSKGLLAP